MRVETHKPRTRSGPFTPSEDTAIARAHADGVSHAVTGAKLGRSAKSIQGRVYVLRKAGVIPGYSARRRVVEVACNAVGMAPPLTLRLDGDLVRSSLRQGGFPRIVQTTYGGVLAGPDGMPWRFGEPVEVRA